MGTAEKLQQTSDELGSQTGVSSIPLIYIERPRLRLKNVQVFETLLSGSNSFILGHPVNGKLGVTTGLGGGQVVLGSSGANVTLERVKRSYIWETTTDLERGTKSDNIDLSQGFIQLGNVTVKNIRLNHKSK